MVLSVAGPVLSQLPERHEEHFIRYNDLVKCDICQNKDDLHLLMACRSFQVSGKNLQF